MSVSKQTDSKQTYLLLSRDLLVFFLFIPFEFFYLLKSPLLLLSGYVLSLIRKQRDDKYSPHVRLQLLECLVEMMQVFSSNYRYVAAC